SGEPQSFRRVSSRAVRLSIDASKTFLPGNIETLSVLRARSCDFEATAVRPIANLDERVACCYVVVTGITKQITVSNRFSRDVDLKEVRRCPSHRKRRSSLTAIIEVVIEFDLEPCGRVAIGLRDPVRPSSDHRLETNGRRPRTARS